MPEVCAPGIGGTDTGIAINRALAARDGPIAKLIAETGGLNAMIVDSSALPEQVVDDALASAFDSAGQRCSALRVLCLQEDIAAGMLEMLEGGMRGTSMVLEGRQPGLEQRQPAVRDERPQQRDGLPVHVRNPLGVQRVDLALRGPAGGRWHSSAWPPERSRHGATPVLSVASATTIKARRSTTHPDRTRRPRTTDYPDSPTGDLHKHQTPANRPEEVQCETKGFARGLRGGIFTASMPMPACSRRCSGTRTPSSATN